MLWGFLHYGTPSDFTWDIVTGISAGSINTLIFLGYPVGQELAATEFGSDKWLTLKNKDVWQNWFGSVITGLTVKAGLFDNSPLLNYLQSIIDTFKTTAFQRDFVITSINANDGKTIRFDQTNI